MFSPPIPQISTAAVVPTSTSNAALELTADELAIVKKYTTLYSEADKGERYNLLKTKILPRLYLLNKDLSSSAWKDRKSVSTL
jgi:hypothetical protein